MKIGFSLGRCVRDIVNEQVSADDVLVIVASTRFETDEQLKGIINDYMFRDDYLYGLDEELCQAVALNLFREGKIHQPRNFGQYRGMIRSEYIWADLVPTNIDSNAAVQQAWQAYRFMLSLTEQIPESQDENWKQSLPKIYESPDGGKTVYVRESGSTERELHSIDPELAESVLRMFEEQMWSDILKDSKTNATLKGILDQAVMVWKLSK